MAEQVKCRRKLASEEESIEMKTYGDLGYKCMGKIGGYLTEFLILMSQAGGSVAYLVFIGQNLSSIFHGYGLTLASAIFLLVPIEIVLSWVGSLSALAPFSIFADTCNALAMAVVVKENIQKVLGGEFSFRDRMIITSNLEGLSFAGGMAVFCFGGFGMTLALETSMKERSTFLKLLAKTFTGITLVYVLFGFSGYMAYGDNTKEIVTLNLPHNWWAIAVEVMFSNLVCLVDLSTNCVMLLSFTCACSYAVLCLSLFSVFFYAYTCTSRLIQTNLCLSMHVQADFVYGNHILRD